MVSLVFPTCSPKGVGGEIWLCFSFFICEVGRNFLVGRGVLNSMDSQHCLYGWWMHQLHQMAFQAAVASVHGFPCLKQDFGAC